MSKKVLLAFAAGLAAGALAGVLLAPDKGKKTRKKLAGAASDMADTVKDKFQDFVDGLKDVYASAKDDADDIADKAVAKMNALKSEAKKATT